MVTKLYEALEQFPKGPPCLWQDEFNERIMKEKFSAEGMLVISPHHRYRPWEVRHFGEISSYASRIEAVNEYFRVKAGRVFGNTRALEILGELHNKQVIPKDEWEQFDINHNAVALAMLSAAGFCEIHEYSVSITDEGKQFLDDILE